MRAQIHKVASSVRFIKIVCIFAMLLFTSCKISSTTELRSNSIGPEVDHPRQQNNELQELQPQSPNDLLLSSKAELSLERLERMALRNNPSVTKAVLRARALRGKRKQVGLPPNPEVGYIGEEIGNERSAGKQGGFISQRFVTGNKLELNRRIVAHEIAQAQKKLSAQEQRVRTDIRTAFYEVLIAQRQVELARELIDISKRAVTASKHLLEANEIPRVGLLQTEIESRNASMVLNRAENSERGAWRRLTSILGQKEIPIRQLKGDLSQVSKELKWDKQLSRLLAKSPEIAIMNAKLERARLVLKRANSEFYPDIDLRVSVQQDSETDDTVTGIQISLPIPLWNRNQGGIHQARNELSAVKRESEQLELDLRRRLANAFQKYSDSKHQVSEFTNHILPKAKEALDLITKGYQAGEIGYLETITAQRMNFKANLSYIKALSEFWKNKVFIEGLLLDQSLSSTAE